MKFVDNGVIHFVSSKDIETLKWKFASLTVEGDKIVWVLPKWIEVMENPNFPVPEASVEENEASS